MCGIAGIVSVARPSTDGLNPESRAVLDRMLGALQKRGPESATVAVLGRSLLGHCLLSFGLEAQEQPIRSRCGKVGLTYNGEIYNQKALGERFGIAVTTEAQLLVDLYLQLGVGFMRELRGMFSIAIVDERHGRVFLGRDHLGKKPLYYFRAAEQVVFASELKALWKHPDCSTQLDHDAIARYCFFQAVPAPYTMLRDVRKLRAGSWVELSETEAHETVYWQLEPDAAPELLDPRPAHVVLEEQLTRAVLARTRSTAQTLGVALSGGIDSALVAAIAARHVPHDLTAFTVGFSTPSYDESALAADVARHLGINHHVVHTTGKKLADATAAAFAALDEPLADPSLVPTAILCREAAHSVKALLSGDGADEFFMGYLSFQGQAFLRRVESLVPGSALTLARSAILRLPGSERNLAPSRVLRMLANAIQASPVSSFYAARAPLGLAAMGPVWSEAIRDSIRTETILDELEAFTRVANGASDEQTMQRSIVCHFLRDVILTKVDRASMMSSIEVRSPFLDLDLVGWAMSLPARDKIRRGTGKVVLRDLARRLLPPALATRRKQGFRLPVGYLLRNDLRPLLIDTLSARTVTQVGVFDAKATVRLVDAHLRGVRDHDAVLWALLSFHRWHEKFTDERVRKAPTRGKRLTVLSTAAPR